MKVAVLRRAGLACLCAAVLRAQQAPLDAKARELVEQADAALAKAKAVSVVQTRKVIVQADGADVEAGGETMEILAGRPGFFRVKEKGETGEAETVSTGGKWIRYAKDVNAYQETDVSGAEAEDLFRPPQLKALLATGRGLTSLWLGKHSLACLFEGATACMYTGLQKLDGVDTHRVDIVLPDGRLVVSFATAAPHLPVRIVSASKVDAGNGEKIRVRHEVGFRDWQLDPAIPDGAFVFQAPAGTKLVDNVQTVQVEARAGKAPQQGTPTGKPFPTGEGVHLSRDILASIKETSRDLDRKAYEKHGHHDPKWDKQVLELYAKWTERIYGDMSYALLLDIHDQALYVQSLGCHDPVVLYRLANSVQYLEGEAVAEPLLAKVWEQFDASTYPASCRLSPLRRHIGVLKMLGSKDKAKVAGLRGQLAECFAKAAAEPEYGGEGARLFLSHFNDSWNELDKGERDETLAAMAALPDANPWLLSYFSGMREIDIAWEARGSGWASTVTEEGWKGFSRHLDIAQSKLAAAYRLHPEIPQPCMGMITIAMAGHADESARTWFDRAIAGQMDYGVAYDRLRYAYSLRWGGDTDWTFALGMEAAETKLFDSSVPEQYWHCLAYLVGEKESWQSIMSRPGAYETLLAVCDGYLGQGGAPRHWHTVRMVAHWGAGNGEMAKKELEWLEYQPLLRVCSAVRTAPDDLVGEILVMAGPQKEPGMAGLALLRAEKYEQAVPLLRQAMLAAADAEPKAYAYLGDHIASIPLASAPGGADTILDAIVDMRRREVLVQSFVRWMEEADGKVPEAFQDRVAQYLGPFCWAFMQHAPTTNELADGEIASRTAALDAVTMADIPGTEGIPAERAKDLLETERILAKLRLEYCRQTPGNTTTASWKYVRANVNPVFKAIPYRGRLVDFATEHQNLSRHKYQYATWEALKTWIQAQGVGIWDCYSYSLPPKLEPLKAIADPAERAEATWELLWHWGGSVRFLFIGMDFLRKSGDAREAAIAERHILSYLALLRVPTTSRFVFLSRAAEFDSIPGYEQRVLDYALASHRENHPLAEARMHEANAALRINDLDRAIEALFVCPRAGRDSQWITVLDERYHGTDEAFGPLLRAVAHHPQATPETITLLERLFPDHVADMEIQ